MNALLIREPPTQDGVFGQMDVFSPTDQGQVLGHFYTAEDDWRQNAKGVSCIPAGTYLCRIRWSPKFQKKLFEVMKVPGRGDILIHSGNTEEDVEGCILLGERFGTLNVGDEDTPGRPSRAKMAVLDSRTALKRFMGLLAGRDEFTLEIRWAQGEP
jgi:hypothetical protein